MSSVIDTASRVCAELSIRELWASCFAVVVFPQALGPSINTAPMERSFCSSNLSRIRGLYVAINHSLNYESHDLADFDHVIWPYFITSFGPILSRHLANFYHVVWPQFITSFGRFLPRSLALSLRCRTQQKPPQTQFLPAKRASPSHQNLLTPKKRFHPMLTSEPSSGL